MPHLKLTVLSLRYSSWSMRPWLALTHAGARFDTETVELAHMQDNGKVTTLTDRRTLGSVHGLFPVLRIDNKPIHESLAICEYAAERFPDAGLWPQDTLARAQARAVSCEMASGFSALRGELPCHLFGRLAGFKPGTGAQADISRIFEIWRECLERSSGPFLFGGFCIADAMYFPVLTRFRTYGVRLDTSLEDYAHALETLPAVRKLMTVAKTEPHIPVYDAELRAQGGDPDAALSPA